jgi:hypothetical protein
MDQTTGQQTVNLVAGFLGDDGRTDLVPPASTSKPGTWPVVTPTGTSVSAAPKTCSKRRRRDLSVRIESVLIEHPAPSHRIRHRILNAQTPFLVRRGVSTFSFRENTCEAYVLTQDQRDR